MKAVLAPRTRSAAACAGSVIVCKTGGGGGRVFVKRVSSFWRMHTLQNRRAVCV